MEERSSTLEVVSAVGRHKDRSLLSAAAEGQALLRKGEKGN